MDFKELVLKAFRIIWSHKWLWVFGLFAGGGSFTPNWNFNFNDPRGMPRDIDPVILEWLRQNTGLIVAFGIILAIFVLFFFALSLIAHGALIAAGKDLDEEKETSFKAAFNMGLASFWRLLRYSLLVGLIVFGLILALFTPLAIVLMGRNTLWIGAIAALTVLLAIFVLIPLAVIGSIIINFGLRAVVLENQGAVAGIKSAWRLFRINAGQSLLVWAVAFGLTIGFSFCLILFLILLLIPLALAGVVAYMSRFNLAAVASAAFLGLAFLAAILVVLSGWGAFLSVYWTLAYNRLMALSDSTKSTADPEAPPE